MRSSGKGGCVEQELDARILWACAKSCVQVKIWILERHVSRGFKSLQIFINLKESMHNIVLISVCRRKSWIVETYFAGQEPNVRIRRSISATARIRTTSFTAMGIIASAIWWGAPLWFLDLLCGAECQDLDIIDCYCMQPEDISIVKRTAVETILCIQICLLLFLRAVCVSLVCVCVCEHDYSVLNRCFQRAEKSS